MAIVNNFVNGDGQVQVQNKALRIMNQMIVDGSLTASDYIVPDSTLLRFRRDMNTIMAQFVTDVTGFSSYTSLGEGDSWQKCREVCKVNFDALDAIVNP